MPRNVEKRPSELYLELDGCSSYPGVEINPNTNLAVNIFNLKREKWIEL
jgi:hypothetical protein